MGKKLPAGQFQLSVVTFLNDVWNTIDCDHAIVVQMRLVIVDSVPLLIFRYFQIAARAVALGVVHDE